MLIVTASVFGKPVFAASLLDISGARADERWNLQASATRSAFDAQDNSPDVPRFVTRSPFHEALEGDASRASLSFDWQRRIGSDRFAARAFATGHGVDLRSAADSPPEAELGARWDQRERRSAFDFTGEWSRNTVLAGFAGSSRAGVRLRSERLDAEGLLGQANGAPRDVLSEDRLRQSSVGLHFENELQLSRGLRATAGVRVDRFRLGVRSDLAGNPGSESGTQVSPLLSLSATPSSNLEVFAALGRGLRAGAFPGAAIDPRSGTPIGRLDPAAAAATSEVGLRTRAFGMDTKVSAWRATSAGELTLLAGGASAWSDRAARRDAVRATLHAEPAAWLALDFEAAAIDARYADGSGEPIPGAVRRYGQAGATVRPARGWNASLFVTSFEARPVTAEDANRTTSFVSGRITRYFSKTTRVSLDVFNLLDKRPGSLDYFSATRLWSYPGAADNFLFYPGESRGLRLRLHTTF